MAVGTLGVDTLALGGAPPQARQIGLRPRFVQEDQSGGVEAGLTALPGPPRPRDLRVVLFAGPECLFLYVSPIFSSA